MITTNKSGFFAVVKIRHEQWQNWESMPMPMFLEVPFSMPVSMAMFFMESFSMANGINQKMQRKLQFFC